LSLHVYYQNGNKIKDTKYPKLVFPLKKAPPTFFSYRHIEMAGNDLCFGRESDVWIINKQGRMTIYSFPSAQLTAAAAFINHMLWGWDEKGNVYCSPMPSFEKSDEINPYMDEEAIRQAIDDNDPRFKGITLEDHVLYVDGKPWMDNMYALANYYKLLNPEWEKDERHQVKPNFSSFDGRDKKGNSYWGAYLIRVMGDDGFMKFGIKADWGEEEYTISGTPTVNENGDIFFIAYNADATSPANAHFNLYKIPCQW
jgi:hypothetical protein